MKKSDAALVLVPRPWKSGRYSVALARDRQGFARMVLLRNGKRFKGHAGTAFLKVGKETFAMRLSPSGEIMY